MDGTIAVFKPVDRIETLYERGYFANLEPIKNVLQAIKLLISEHPEIEVCILSAYLADSKYAFSEKNEWLDKYLPEIEDGNRFFSPCGFDKKDFIPGGIRINDVLLDDYTKNLESWQPPGRGIKLLNGINHTKGTWKHDLVSFDKIPELLMNNITEILARDAYVRAESSFFVRSRLIAETDTDNMYLGISKDSSAEYDLEV
jgi:5'(3')-deoxyribonucleotidase